MTRVELTRKETSARTCLVTAAILFLLGLVVMSPEAGVLLFAISGLLSAAGLLLGYKRFAPIAIVLIIVNGILIATSMPAAMESYGRYLDKADDNGAVEAQ